MNNPNGPDDEQKEVAEDSLEVVDGTVDVATVDTEEVEEEAGDVDGEDAEQVSE